MKLIEIIRKAWRKLLHGRDCGVEVVELPDGRSYVRATRTFVSVGDVTPIGEDVEVKKLQAPAMGADETNHR